MPLFTAGNLKPKREATQITNINLIHCRLRRRNVSAKHCPPYGCSLCDCLPLVAVILLRDFKIDRYVLTRDIDRTYTKAIGFSVSL
ncbi:MAG: hypothetical protein LBL62_11030, partial [Planctomycetaceae bacterium]|nr:hypothetical protein [Planctomycetaceae bacterium]